MKSQPIIDLQPARFKARPCPLCRNRGDVRHTVSMYRLMPPAFMDDYLVLESGLCRKYQVFILLTTGGLMAEDPARSRPEFLDDDTDDDDDTDSDDDDGGLQ